MIDLTERERQLLLQVVSHRALELLRDAETCGDVKPESRQIHRAEAAEFQALVEKLREPPHRRSAERAFEEVLKGGAGE